MDTCMWPVQYKVIKVAEQVVSFVYREKEKKEKENHGNTAPLNLKSSTGLGREDTKEFLKQKNSILRLRLLQL